MVNPNIGIDLGTATVLVYVKGKGIVLKDNKNIDPLSIINSN